MALVMSDAVFEALVEAGVVRREERVTRLVIDLRVGHAAVVHVERLGDQKLLQVIPALEGVEVSREELAKRAKSSPAGA